MSGIFDLKKGAFDSSEAALLHEAYAIALQGLRTTHDVDRLVAQRLARSIVKVARTEPDCLRNDGGIDPVRLAQRAVLRMLQMSAPAIGIKDEETAATSPGKLSNQAPAGPDNPSARASDSPAKIMLRLFERTRFAKL